MVVATQNPFEFEGTYYLPENSWTDFFLKIELGYRSVRRSTNPERQPGRTALEKFVTVATAQEWSSSGCGSKDQIGLGDCGLHSELGRSDPAG